MTDGYNNIAIPNPVQGYVDDIVICATQEQDLLGMCDKTDSFVTVTGKNIKHRKCAVLHGQRCGNNWSKHDGTSGIQITIQNQPIPKLGKSGKYTYLGHDISLDGKASEAQLSSIAIEFHNTLRKINECPLPVSAKIQAANDMAISKLNFYFSNITFPAKTLANMEDNIVKYIREWFHLNKSSNRDIIFLPSSKGGLGVLSPSSMYVSKKLSFLLQALNSDDPQTKYSARSSFQLHISKRKAVLHDANEGAPLFGGYGVDSGGRVIKRGKVNWPKSIWVEFNELCIREKLQLEVHNDVYAIVAEHDSVSLVFRSHTALSKYLKQTHVTRRINRLRNLYSQGRIFRVDCNACNVSLNFYLTQAGVMVLCIITTANSSARLTKTTTNAAITTLQKDTKVAGGTLIIIALIAMVAIAIILKMWAADATGLVLIRT
ncbi:Retrovirus-related Pol polyprotein from type-2 retrotransposable element R2DM [Holothuria leucospilota]|uniref:Retrovirus-related Pol polyprotein from type-2 retrotransposable element R2DM n=1 Tax=Holothuria leucospilota TaxID=206669 RepID=A0A9Q1BWC7_HOLLE|nr:Retrovirus-related Pol polyprotein from type-2 retrotransposable element R2DM [Holothuria leucospilota]